MFKGGDPTSLGNYRPISVLPVFAKILEKLMYNRVYNYLTENRILFNKQFGFRRGYSTEMVLLTALDELSSALDMKRNVIGVYLDLRKAFDTVNIDILLAKLFKYGIRGIAHQWFTSYLNDRSQRVKIGCSFSEMKSISCGVPQGSTLGPLLFLLYINDLPNVLTNIFPIIFADDTSLFMTGVDINDMTEAFNHQLSKINEWLIANKLSLNIQKTYSMLFKLSPHLYSSPIPITINNTEIQRVHSTRFLVVIIDDRLTWANHITHVSNKIAKSIGIINKVKHSLKQDTLMILYYSLIYPYLTYCFLLWGKASHSHINKLTILQKRVIRIITNSGFRDHTRPLFNTLRIIHMDDLFTYLCSVYIFKCIKIIFPRSFLDILNYFTDYNSNAPRSSTRASLTRSINVPLCRTTLRQKQLRFQSIKLYNNFLMPLEILDNSNSISHFRRFLKNVLS
jgi:hypothetical protein